MFGYLKWFFSVELLYSLLILSGYFKESLWFIDFDLTIILILLTFIMVFLKSKKEGFIINKHYLIPISLFMIIQFIMILSLYYAPGSIEESLEKTLRFLIVTSWCFLGGFFIITDRESIKKYLLGVFIVTFIMSISSFLSTQSNMESFVAVGAFGTDNYIPLARASAISIIILLSFYIMSKSNIYVRFFALFLSLIIVSPLMKSGGRLTIIVLIIVICLIPFLLIKINYKKDILIKKNIKYLLPMFVLISLALTIITSLGHADRLIMRFEVLNEEVNSGSSVAGRSDRMEIGLNMIQESYLFGQGINSFSEIYNGIKFDTPHNMYLEYAAELGIVVFILFVIIVFLSFYNGLKSYKVLDRSFLTFTILVISIFWLVNSLGSSSINGDRMFYSLLSIMYVSPYIISKEQKNKNSL